MLTIKQIRDDKAAAVRRLAKKGVDAAPAVDRILTLDDRRKAIQAELDATLAAQNKAAKEIGALMGQGRRDEAEERKRFVSDLKEKSSQLQTESKEVQDELQATLVTLPNFPAEIVPEGRTAEDNVVVKLVENYTALPENPLPHWELARKYDIIDFDLGVKLTGAGFPVYKGKGARLQRALINYFLDCNTRAGYLEVEPPVMVNEASGFGTGQLPDKEGQMYHATADNYYFGADGRSSGDQHLPRRHSRQERFPGEDDRLHAVLPPRSGLLRQGRARTEPPAPIRQGGNRTAVAARDLV